MPRNEIWHKFAISWKALLFQYFRSYGCQQIKQLLSIQHIENQTLVALDARITKTKKKVEFTIDKMEENIVRATKKPIVDEELSSSTDQEDSCDDEQNISKRRHKRHNKDEKL